MKCRRVEKLIPLYVERDLESGIADRISSHLDWCGRCNWLADEYRESQTWLRSSPAPEFDEAALNGFKAEFSVELRDQRKAFADCKPDPALEPQTGVSLVHGGVDCPRYGGPLCLPDESKARRPNTPDRGVSPRASSPDRPISRTTRCKQIRQAPRFTKETCPPRGKKLT